MKKYLSLAVFLTLGLLLTPDVARADSITLTLDSTSVPQFISPYGTIQLDLLGSTIKVTVDLAATLATGQGYNIIDTGSHHAVAFNGTLGGAVTIGSFSSTDIPPFTSTLYSDGGGAGGNSPFGNFQYTVDSTCTNGGGCGVNVLSFVVSRTGGFNTVDQLLDLNGGGSTAYFAVDVANSEGNTGVIGVTSKPRITTTPEPWSVLTLGIALLGFGYITRKHGFSHSK